MKNHGFWMIIGRFIPLLLIFFAPALGLGNNSAFFVFIVVMFICHFAMMGRHGNEHRHKGHHES